MTLLKYPIFFMSVAKQRTQPNGKDWVTYLQVTENSCCNVCRIWKLLSGGRSPIVLISIFLRSLFCILCEVQSYLTLRQNVPAASNLETILGDSVSKKRSSGLFSFWGNQEILRWEVWKAVIYAKNTKIQLWMIITRQWETK